MWCNGTKNTLTKYNYSSFYGSVDNKTVLEVEDDAANQNWGGTWRMPTKSEFIKLFNNCTWTWTKLNSVAGYKVTGTNGNWIFLPAAGRYHEYGSSNRGSYGYYWSKTLVNSEIFGPNVSHNLEFYSNSSKISADESEYRYEGLSVRPVSE